MVVFKGEQFKEYMKDFYIIQKDEHHFKLEFDMFGRVHSIRFIEFPKNREELEDLIGGIEFLDIEYLAGISVPSKRSGILFSYRNPFIKSEPIPWNSGKNQIGKYYFREGIQFGSGSESEYISMQFYEPDYTKVYWMPTLGIIPTLKKEDLSKSLGLGDRSIEAITYYEESKL